MTVSTPIHRLLPCLGATALLALSTGACRDAADDPVALVETGEIRSTLAVEPGLPSLVDLAARTGVESEISGDLADWSASWTLDAEEGRRMRDDLYASAVEPLARVADDALIREAVDDVGAALEAVQELDLRSLPEPLLDAYARATELHAGALTAMDAGRTTRALELALTSADALRAAGPESVARLLVESGEAALERERQRAGRDDFGNTRTDLDRSGRLLRGARLALESGEWTRALRRAFYACQLLGVEPY